MPITRQCRGVLLAVILSAVASCGGDGGGSPAAVQSDGEAGGSKTTQCHAGGQVVATVFVDAPGDLFYALHTRVTYPALLDVPGHADWPSVTERVRFGLDLPLGRMDTPEETFINGTSIVNDEDTDFDGVDDRIQTLLLSRAPFADGKFVDITFDCADTITWPTTDAFACEVAGATDLGANEQAVLSSCHVVVQPPA